MKDIAPEAPPRNPEKLEPPVKRSLWRNRDFMLLWSGQSVSELGSAITQLAIPLAAVVLLNSSTFEVGLLAMMGTLPYLLVALLAGAIIDRRAKRKIMLWCDIGRFLLLGSIPSSPSRTLACTSPTSTCCWCRCSPALWPCFSMSPTRATSPFF